MRPRLSTPNSHHALHLVRCLPHAQIYGRWRYDVRVRASERAAPVPVCTHFVSLGCSPLILMIPAWISSFSSRPWRTTRVRRAANKTAERPRVGENMCINVCVCLTTGFVASRERWARRTTTLAWSVMLGIRAGMLAHYRYTDATCYGSLATVLKPNPLICDIVTLTW